MSNMLVGCGITFFSMLMGWAMGRHTDRESPPRNWDGYHDSRDDKEKK